jgi:peptide/nickel transport system ATP-binding protein/oligopeptide transport system ATP-binding protein
LPRCRDDRPALEPLGRTLVSCWAAEAGPAPDRHAGPSIGGRVAAGGEAAAPAVTVRDLHVRFPIRRGVLRRAVGHVRAVDGVSFTIPAGTTLGLVGESGSGKTTTGRALIGLAPVAAGEIRLFGRSLEDMRRTPPALPRLGQIVFQDPYSSLNPRMTVGRALREVVTVHGLAPPGRADARVRDLLDSVGLPAETAQRYPHELSGGQRQRVAIARALAIEPSLIVCDEVVSALDASIQGQITNLLQDLQRDRRLTYLFITHDLGAVRHVAHRIAVMYGGKVMELASRDRLFAAPLHPYTHALLSAVPIADPRIERGRRRVGLRAEPPDPADPPPGCRFQRSCTFATDLCRALAPALAPAADEHEVACHRWDDEEVRGALAPTPGP